ncbi:MAG: hypothetical protein M1819_005671 [Sarea resinae]|nr:MAG: hypothetical protein M1819_005671 [Sarea resinae]
MSKKLEFIVILPDKEGSLERRMKVRPDHLSAVSKQVEAGFWTFGGALLEDHPKEGESPKINGSIMLASADSKEEVIETLKNDTYYQNEVWDWEKVKVYPFKTAVRKAL